MYGNIKSAVSVNGTTSNCFQCNIGVRQGENLSPLMFSIYLNDLHNFISNSGIVNGVNINQSELDNNALTFLKLFIILYADDTVLMSESANDLQNSLNKYQEYCDTWKLTVNTSKSNILIFSKGRLGNYNFTYQGQALEIVNEYKYLGILFSKSGSFYNAKKHIAKQGTRALYSLLKKVKRLSLPIDMQIDIFNKTVKPVLLYGCEIWGFGNLEIIERVQLKFLKYILNVRKSTPSCIIYGETGVTPIKIDIHTRMISYWSKIVSQDQNKLSYNIYQVMLSVFNNTSPDIVKKKFGWLECIKSILVNCGYNNIWQSHYFPNAKWLKVSIGQKLKDLFINEWYSTIETSRCCTTYRLFKDKFGFEKYLITTPQKYLRFIIKFRTGNNKFPVITGTM